MRQSARSERGAALFIVILVVTVLAAIGIFAARVTSLVGVAAGYSRRAASAFYLSDYAMNVVAADMAAGVDQYSARMKTIGNDCRQNTNAPLGTDITCAAIEYPELVRIIDSTAPTEVTTDSQGLLGELVRPDNPGTPINGTLRVELTDLHQAPNAKQGSPMSGAGTAYYWQVFYTVTASVIPTTAGGECDINATRASESQTLRGYVQFTTTQ